MLSWWQGDVTATGQINSGEDIVVNQHYQTDRDAEGRRRLDPDAARVRDPRPLRLGDGQQERAGATGQVRRRQRRRDDRLGRPGVRPADRQARLQLGRLQAHLRRATLTQFRRRTASLGTCTTSTRSIRSATARSWSRCATPGRCTWSNEKTGDGRVDARRQALELRGAQGRPVRVAARRQMLNSTTVSVFDDHCCDITGAGVYLDATGPSRGLVLKLEPADTHGQAREAVLARSHGRVALHGQRADAGERQRVRRLGRCPVHVSSSSKSGQLIYDAVLPTPDITYRAYVQHWVGLPLYPPSGAALAVAAAGRPCTRAGTERRRSLPGRCWRSTAIRASEPSSAQKPKTGSRPRSPSRAEQRRFELEALDAAGHVIGTSKSFVVKGG